MITLHVPESIIAWLSFPPGIENSVETSFEIYELHYSLGLVKETRELVRVIVAFPTFLSLSDQGADILTEDLKKAFGDKPIIAFYFLGSQFHATSLIRVDEFSPEFEEFIKECVRLAPLMEQIGKTNSWNGELIRLAREPLDEQKMQH